MLHKYRDTGNRRRKRVGQGRKQRRGRKTKATAISGDDDVMMDDNCVVEDHVITRCPEGSGDGNHVNNSTHNTPPVVFTPAQDIINEGL